MKTLLADTGNYSRYLFWSYTSGARLPAVEIIRQVLAYGEISDLVLLSKQFPVEDIMNVIESWKEKDRFRKRINLLQKVMLDK